MLKFNINHNNNKFSLKQYELEWLIYFCLKNILTDVLRENNQEMDVHLHL